MMKGNRLVRDIADSLGKLPPQAIDLEEAVLGAILIDRRAIHEVVDILSPEDFYREQHQEIYRACLTLYQQGHPIDMMTAVNKLRELGKLEIVGGSYYIADITSRLSSAANIQYHARILTEYKIKRELIQQASSMHHLAYEDTTDAFELLGDAQSKLDGIGGKYLKGNFQTSLAISQDVIKKIGLRLGQGGITGVATHLKQVDKVTGGWQNTDLTIIGARPGMGKTAMLMTAALNAAMIDRIPTAFFSLEMSAEQLMIRAYSGIAKIENTRIFKNLIDEDEHFRILEAGTQMDCPLFIDDTPAITIMEFRARARRLVHDQGVKIIFVDYLQLMKGDGNEGNRVNEIGTISRGLKRVAKEMNIPVIAACQLSRAVEGRSGEKRPNLSDLRESGDIEQDADLVMFLYRPEYYKIMKDERGNSTEGLLELIIAKHRNGGLDTIPLRYIGKYTQVVNFETQEQLPIPALANSTDELPF